MNKNGCLNIDKYINWDDIWLHEISLDNDFGRSTKHQRIINQFLLDKNVKLDWDECNIDGNNLIFQFSEDGGQNESDSLGWSRSYVFIFDEDFLLIDAEYSQG